MSIFVIDHDFVSKCDPGEFGPNSPPNRSCKAENPQPSVPMMKEAVYPRAPADGREI